MDLNQLNDALAESNRRARRGRAIAWAMLVVTAALAALIVDALVLTPQCGSMMCPMFVAGPEHVVVDVTLGIGFAGLAIGLTWMWRIVRADPDPDPRSWRHLRRG